MSTEQLIADLIARVERLEAGSYAIQEEKRLKAETAKREAYLASTDDAGMLLAASPVERRAILDAWPLDRTVGVMLALPATKRDECMAHLNWPARRRIELELAVRDERRVIRYVRIQAAPGRVTSRQHVALSARAEETLVADPNFSGDIDRGMLRGYVHKPGETLLYRVATHETMLAVDEVYREACEDGAIIVEPLSFEECRRIAIDTGDLQ